MFIREIQKQDLPQLLTLYTHLHNNPFPLIDHQLEALWSNIINDPNHHIVAGFIGDSIIASCVLLVVPNLTHDQRPYALVENVITHPAHRSQGYATQVLNQAREIALKNRCYKIMLMTGSKEQATLNLYRQAGYNANDKTAFIQWLY